MILRDDEMAVLIRALRGRRLDRRDVLKGAALGLAGGAVT